MRIIRQKRLSARRPRAGYRPIVASFERQPVKINSHITAHKVFEQSRRKPGKVDSRGWVEPYSRIEFLELRGLCRSQQRDQLRVLQLAPGVAGHRVRRHTVQ